MCAYSTRHRRLDARARWLGGGVLAGMRIGGEHLGKELSAMMGAFYGPTAVLPAAVVGLIVLAWLR